MTEPAGRRPLVVGVGNSLRRDDGAGPHVARALARLGWETRELPGDGAELLDLFDGRDAVVVVDALASGAAPGTVTRIDAAQTPLPPGRFRGSSHLFGLAEAVETARALGRLPESLVVYGIEGADFAFGEGLTDAVAAGCDRAIARILTDHG